MADRHDLILEADGTFGSDGSWSSDWIDSAGVYQVRVVATGEEAVSGTTVWDGHASVDQTSDLSAGWTFADTVMLDGTSSSVQGDALIGARYFRVRVTGGSSGDPFHVSVRVI